LELIAQHSASIKLLADFQTQGPWNYP
jgi:hypothetical protein